ncbi:MAG: branched-chain amino acid ABC transporter substrate-binding protein [Rhodoferax sp.]|uniref:branched-chain amino acid ABC transporter substrate-binding protein n=1 Tax=Rhodoferax sp. TaxID=50421 RepID=UPI0026195A2A|nr:branched-chain amino acid ABC transporter substrate-binding protein [Rhodoferax sp.]MDD2879906.1 branched-chain amino acid ABC transporter substrate-binding protein [Rhodoferax sp.]
MRGAARLATVSPCLSALKGAIGAGLVCSLALACGLASAAPLQNVTVAVLSLASDARYTPKQLERAYPDHPGGRVGDAARMAVDDAALELQELGLAFKLKDVPLADAQALPKVLAELKAARVQHIVADLPPELLTALVKSAPAALGGAMILNVSADSDALRNEACSVALLHTYPSRQMYTDALAQYLAARNWRKLLLLQGPILEDQLQGAAMVLSAKRYGLKILQTKPFKLSGDPRERDLFNTRLLTNERDHEVVAVMDSQGEFARTLPYATQWPRPVMGSNGLMAMAWHPQWDRNGGPQISRRFQKLAKRSMQSQDWAAWIAVKAIAAVVAADPKADVAKQLKQLRAGDVVVDGNKGPGLTFRAWDGQLRQPIMLGHGDGVVGIAPLDGILHPTEVMDTLGTDQKESKCQQRS